MRFRVPIRFRYVLIPVFVLIPLCFSCGNNPSVDKNGVTRTNDTTKTVAYNKTEMDASIPAKIISFAPSITEMLYELGLGDNVSGVTQFCKYPPEAAGKTKIGGYADHNYEAVIRLKPDLAIVLKEQRDLIQFFGKYSITYITVGSDSVDEIIESIQSIAKACNIIDRGDSIARKLRSSLNDAPVSTDGSRPKVLLCVSRDNVGGGAISKCFIAGDAAFYNQLIESAGGVNVLKGTGQAYPSISAEAVIRLNPDIIIDISSANSNKPQQAICGDWKTLKTVAAVKTDNVHCLYGDYLTIPGPRFTLILDDLKSIFNRYGRT